MVLLVIDESGSGLTFYTEEERILSMTEGFRLSEEELKVRMEASMEEYLESDLHAKFVKDRIDTVIANYPEYDFDIETMAETANTMVEVRDKFDALRSANYELEEQLSSESSPPGKGRNVHLSRLISFLRDYVMALKVDRKLELTLIGQLPGILNEELGNLTSIEDIPRIFMEGVGKGVSGIVNLGTGLFTDVVGGIASGLAEGFLGKDWKKKAIIIAVVAIVIAIVGLIGFQYSKSYISAKAKKRAN